MDPDGTNEAVNLAKNYLDPPDNEPSFSLNARQLGLLKSRQQRDPSVINEKQPFVSRSNMSQQQHNQNQSVELMKDPVPTKDNDFGTSAVKPRAHGPMRTPNPISRFSAAAAHRRQPLADEQGRAAYLRPLLQQRALKKSSTTSADSDPSGKALLRRMLAKVVVKKSKSTSTGASSENSQFREQVRDTAQLATNIAFLDPDRGLPSKTMMDKDRAKTTETNRSERQEAREACKYTSPVDNTVAPKRSRQVDEGLKYRIHEKLRQKPFKMHPCDLKVSAIERPLVMSDDDDGLEGYEHFIKQLRGEVSGKHWQLWRSFSALMTGGDPPDEGIMHIDRPCEFDERTRKNLSVLNLHLKKYGEAECNSKTQLINDRRLSKERINRSYPANQRQAVSNIESSASSSSENSALENDAVLQMRSSLSTALEFSLIELSESLPKYHTDKGASGSSNQQHVDLESAKYHTAKEKDNCAGAKEAPSVTVTGSENRASNSSIVSLDQFELRPSPPSDANGSIIWSDVRLRSLDQVSHNSELDSIKASTPVWANMKLRPVVNFSNLGDDVRVTNSTDFDSIPQVNSGTSQKPIDIEDFDKLQSTDTGTEKKPIFVQTPTAVVYKQPLMDGIERCEKPRPEQRQLLQPTPIPHSAQVLTGPKPEDAHPRVTKLSTGPIGQASGDKIDEATVFKVKQTTNSSLEVERRVIVGKKMIMLVESPVGDSRASVLWKLAREKVESLTLDMALQKVALLCFKGSSRKVLDFISSEDCLKFANTFYNMNAVVPLSKTDPMVSASLLSDDAEIDDSSTTDRLASLNDEEQTLLEMFRLLRRTQPAENAFDTSLSRRGTEAKTLSSTLTPKEEEIAKKYLMMLELKVPLNEVKSSLLKDGVDNKIVTKIMREAVDMPVNVVNAPDLPSSPVSTMTCSVAQVSDESEIAAPYKKMIRLRIPAEAVRHKMIKDEISPRIIDLVLGTGGAVYNKINDDLALSSEEAVLVLKYQKMLKISIAPEAVRHKMRQDQVNNKIIAAVFSQNEKEKVEATRLNLSIEEENIAKKYREMVRLKVPKEGVRHRMTKDQIDKKIVDSVLQDDSCTSKDTSANLPDHRKVPSSSLTSDEETVVLQYKRLLKLQIPKAAILDRMEKEGASANVIKAVLGNVTSKCNPGEKDSDSQSKTGTKLVSLHWTPLSGTALDNSVWAARKRRKDELPQPEGSDIFQLIHLFQKKTANTSVKEGSVDESSSAQGKAMLLEVTRSNNVAISLKAFKDFSFLELAETIALLDPLRKIRGDRILFLRDLLPTISEVQTILAYKGTDDRLVPAERWFRATAQIRRIETKVQVLQSMETLRSEILALCENFRLLARACRQVMESEKLEALLEMVLRVGNIMNEGTRTGGAAGFKFDSLLRLTQTKSSDGRTTVLDFLVTVFVAKGSRGTLNLSSDISDCHMASRMLMSDMSNDVKNIRQALDVCSTELAALRDEITSSTIEGKKSGQCNDLKRTEHAVFSKREEFLAAVSKSSEKKSKINGEASLSTDLSEGCDKDSVSHDIHGGINRLERFIGEGNVIFDSLEGEREDAFQACGELSKYCGESGGVGAACPLLGILAQFATSIDAALAKHDKLKASEARRLKRDDDRLSPRSFTTEQTNSVSSQKDDGKSLILLVNEMLKEASDRAKDDFRKGRIYPTPSTALKAIYEKEERQVMFASPTSSRRKIDLLTAIRMREGRVKDSESLEVQSTLNTNNNGAEHGCDEETSKSLKAGAALNRLQQTLIVDQSSTLKEVASDNHGDSIHLTSQTSPEKQDDFVNIHVPAAEVVLDSTSTTTNSASPIATPSSVTVLESTVDKRTGEGSLQSQVNMTASISGGHRIAEEEVKHRDGTGCCPGKTVSDKEESLCDANRRPIESSDQPHRSDAKIGHDDAPKDGEVKTNLTNPLRQKHPRPAPCFQSLEDPFKARELVLSMKFKDTNCCKAPERSAETKALKPEKIGSNLSPLPDRTLVRRLNDRQSLEGSRQPMKEALAVTSDSHSPAQSRICEPREPFNACMPKRERTLNQTVQGLASAADHDAELSGNFPKVRITSASHFGEKESTSIALLARAKRAEKTKGSHPLQNLEIKNPPSTMGYTEGRLSHFNTKTLEGLCASPVEASPENALSKISNSSPETGEANSSDGKYQSTFARMARLKRKEKRGKHA
jgi:hypothetical protein